MISTIKKFFRQWRLNLLGLIVRGKLGFDKDYQRTLRTTRRTFFPFYSLHSESLKEVLRVKDELISDMQKGYDKDFNEAALLLLSRSIQHFESIFLLTERGLYGDAFTLLRSVMSDMNMFYYLHFNPHLISDFIKESDVDYQSDKNFRSNFNEGAIEKDLEARGVKSIKKSFQILSKTAHASAWGTQLYGTEGKIVNGRQQFHAKYGPGFETKKALVLFSIMVSSHWDYLNMILWHRYHNKLDINSKFWMSIRHRVRDLKPRILDLSDFGESILINFDAMKKRR